jgi:Flp pilus assembly protein TadD
MKFIARYFVLLIAGALVGLVEIAIAGEDFVAKGYQSLDAGRAADAVREFKKALDKNPNELKAHEGLAYAYNKLGYYAQAGWHADQRRLLAPQDHGWRRQRALLLFDDPARRYEAIAEAQELVSERPDDSESKILLGRLMARDGQYAEARTNIELVLMQNPDNIDALRILAWIESIQHNYEEAFQLLQRAGALRPEDAELRAELANAAVIAKRFRAAHSHPTMLLVLGVITVSIIVGQASTKLTVWTYLLIFVSMSLLAGVALAWLYLIPIT